MTPDERLIQIQKMLQAPRRDWSEIARVLEAGEERAETEIARILVQRALDGAIDARLRSVDPTERLAALRLANQLYPRAVLVQTLRRMARDPERRIREQVRLAIEQHHLLDVALPDRRHPAPRRHHLHWPGQWDATGWFAGLREERFPLQLAATQRSPAGLPLLETPGELAAFLGHEKVDSLRPWMRPGSGPGASYIEFTIPKARGGERTLAAPKQALKKIQRKILRELLECVPVHEASHGFVQGRSILTNATPHTGAALILKTDLRDFFPSVHHRRVEGLFLSLLYPKSVARLLAALTTRRATLPDGRVIYPGTLPQGAPTSPAITNLLCRRLDRRLSGLARRLGGRYTRYADDITISLPAAPLPLGRVFWWIDQICQQEGFEENAAKRQVLRSHQQQRVTGIVINEKPAVPRKLRRLLRAILHNCARHGVASQARDRDNFEAWLRGMIAHVHAIQPELGKRWRQELEALLREQRGAPA